MHPNVPPFLAWCERQPEGQRALRREDAAEVADLAIAQHELDAPPALSKPPAGSAPDLSVGGVAAEIRKGLEPLGLPNLKVSVAPTRRAIVVETSRYGDAEEYAKAQIKFNYSVGPNMHMVVYVSSPEAPWGEPHPRSKLVSVDVRLGGLPEEQKEIKEAGVKFRRVFNLPLDEAVERVIRDFQKNAHILRVATPSVAASAEPAVSPVVEAAEAAEAAPIKPSKASAAPSAMLDNLPALSSVQPPYRPFTLYGEAANGAWIPARPPEVQSGPAWKQAAFDILMGPFPLYADDPYRIDREHPDFLTGLARRYAHELGVDPAINLQAILSPLGAAAPSETSYGEDFYRDQVENTYLHKTGPNFRREAFESFTGTASRFTDALGKAWKSVWLPVLGEGAPEIPDVLRRALDRVVGKTYGPFDPTSPIHRIDLAIAREVVAEEAERAARDERYMHNYDFTPKDLAEVDAYLAHYPPVGSFLHGEHATAVFGPLDWSGDEQADAARGMRRYLRWLFPRFLRTHSSRNSGYFPDDDGRRPHGGDFMLLHWDEFTDAPDFRAQRSALLKSAGFEPYEDRKAWTHTGPISEDQLIKWLSNAIMGFTYGDPQWSLDWDAGLLVYRRVPSAKPFQFPIPKLKGKRAILQALFNDPDLVREAARFEALEHGFGVEGSVYKRVKRRWDAVRKQFP